MELTAGDAVGADLHAILAADLWARLMADQLGYERVAAQGGDWGALVTTQLGLAVAIPLVLLHSLLTGRVNRLVEQLGKQSSDMLTSRELA